jgi:exosome complex exonuclease DIS3/RRP44
VIVLVRARVLKAFPVIRERYLRDDVSCGIEKCRECVTTPGLHLPFSGAVDHKLFPNGHFVLPDTNVFLAQVCPLQHADTASLKFILQMDLMESSYFKTPIILLQTVLEEVRHRSLPLYNRLKALMKLDEKRTWMFYNEFRS